VRSLTLIVDAAGAARGNGVEAAAEATRARRAVRGSGPCHAHSSCVPLCFAARTTSTRDSDTFSQQDPLEKGALQSYDGINNVRSAHVKLSGGSEARDGARGGAARPEACLVSRVRGDPASSPLTQCWPKHTHSFTRETRWERVSIRVTQEGLLGAQRSDSRGPGTWGGGSKGMKRNGSEDAGRAGERRRACSGYQRLRAGDGSPRDLR
jgi:hypothetical protein